MKRFVWPLQRLLDVTARREEAARLELARLNRELADAEALVSEQTRRLREALAELARLCIEDRVARAPVLIECMQHRQKGVDAAHRRRDDVRGAKADQTQKLMKLRASRETLERMKEQAYRQYQREQTALEQKQFDETAQIAFAREQIAQRRDRVTGGRP